MSVATNVLQSLHAPLLLATTDIDINGTLSSSHDPNDILLYDFDRQVFLEVMLVYAAPMAAALVAGSIALYQSRFRLGLIPSWLLRDWLGSVLDGADADPELQAKGAAALGETADATFEFYLSWMFPSALFLVVLPPLCMVALLVGAILLLERLFAITVAYMCFLAMLCTWTLLRWQFDGWELTSKVRWMLGSAGATVVAFEVAKAYFARPYTFIGLGVFCLMCNMLGMISLAYMMHEVKHTKFDQYLDMTTPITRVMQQHMDQAAAKAAEAKEAKRSEIERRLMEGPDAVVQPSVRAPAAAKPSGGNDSDSDDEGGASVRLRMPADSSQLASRQHFQAKLSLPRALFSYLRSLIALAGYAVIIHFATDFGTTGFITAAAIVWLDFVVLLWVYAQPERTPLQACLLLALIRFFMIIFGPTYYLVGHSVLFILTSCYFAHCLIDRFAPLSRLRHSNDDEDAMTPAGYAPLAKQQHAAAVKEDEDALKSSGSKATRVARARRERRTQRMGLHLPGLKVSHDVTQVVALVMLVVAFVFDTLLCYYIDDTRVPCGLYTTLPQSIVGFFGLFVFGVFAFSKLTFRIYVNQHYKSHGWVLFLSGFQYVLILVCGWLYHFTAGEKNIPSLCIFLPPMIYFLIGLFSQWVRNDFRIILPSGHRNPPMASAGEAILRCGLPGNDYFMVFGILVEMALIVLLGFALSWYITPSWVGAMVSWVLVVLLTAVTPMVEYFHTFEFSLNMLVMSCVSVVSFFVGLIVTFFVVLDGVFGPSAFLLLLAAFLYPIAICFTLGMAKWHDDEWRVSDFVVWTLFLSAMLLLLMFFAIGLVYTPWWIGGGLMFIEVISLLALMVLPRIKELSPLWYKIVCTSVALLLLAFVVSSTLEDSSGFTAFTLLCGMVFLGLLCVIYIAHRGSPYDSMSIHKHKIVLYSRHVFPIFEFDTMAGANGTNPLTECNERVWSVYGLCGVTYVWGVMALFFLQPTTVGLCVSSLAIAGAMLFTHELMHLASVRNDQLADAIDWLEEGSSLYASTLAQCKWTATKNQLLSDTSMYISTKKNQLAADVILPPDSLVPGSMNAVAYETIMHQLDFQHTHQDWRTTKERYERINARLSKMSCCGLRDDLKVEIEGVRTSRRDAFRLADALFMDGAAFYKRALLYDLNLQQEIIKAVQAKQYDRFVSIVAMLREQGNMAVTVEHLQSLNPLSAEMQQYENQVDAWLEHRAKILAEHARIKAEKDEAQRRRDAQALVAAEHARKLKEERAAAELRQKHLEMETAQKAAEEEAAHLARQQAEELANFEREQQEKLEAEQAAAQREREEEEASKAEQLAEIARQKRIAEKRKEQQEIADRLRAEAEAAMAAKEQAELARLRRKAEKKAKELEHARLLAEKKAKLQAEAEMKRKLAELERKHAEELERVRRQQEAEAHKAKKLQEESAMLAALKAEAEERRIAHEREVEQMRRELEEQEERMRVEKAALAASRAAHEAEMAALAAAEQAARDRAAAQGELERRRAEEEQAKQRAEQAAQEERERALQEQEEANRLKEAEREEQKSKKQAAIAAAKEKKKRELEQKRDAQKKAEAERNQKAKQKLEATCKEESCCTYKQTEQQLTFQAYYACDDCGETKMGGDCFCFACAEACHKGHNVKKVGEALCFCDCGHARATCLMMKSPAEQRAIKERGQVSADLSVASAASTHSSPDDEAAHPCFEIIRSVAARGPDAAWTDPDFAHDDSALFGAAEPAHPEWAGCKWARIKDICKGDPAVFLPPVDANDIRQGSLGNCWFMSACAVLTQKPDALMAVFVTREYNPQGVYGLRFFKNGKVAHVTVDDWLPISKNNAQTRAGVGLDPLFSKAKDGRAIWVMLVEKGFAKLHQSYQNIEGGWIDDALVDLAGGMADRIRWTDEKTKAAMHDGSLFAKLLKYHEQGFLLGCGSPVGSSDSEADASPWGVVQSHAYSILAVAAVDGLQLIHVRNPWGRKEWTGDWSDKSPLWTRRLKSKVKYEDKEDGAFWMSWTDFCANFDELYVSRFFSESLWPSRGKVYGEWRGPSAGGCVNNESVRLNVQYGLTVLEAGPAEITVSVLLEDVRGVAGKMAGDFPCAILEIYDNGGKPITQSVARVRGKQLASTCDNLQEIFVECQVQADGKTTLTVLPCLFEAGVETTYTLNWFCTKRAKLQQFQQANTDDLVVPARR